MKTDEHETAPESGKFQQSTSMGFVGWGSFGPGVRVEEWNVTQRFSCCVKKLPDVVCR